jgi:hypothetical protein
VRLTQSLLPPHWPGMVGGFFGLLFLCIALSESKNAKVANTLQRL